VDAKIKILVVDDFPTMRQIICSLLREFGFASWGQASDGLDALAQLRSGSYRFVVTDWNNAKYGWARVVKDDSG
jgi:two-component system chemotaxis response regulator CheY